MTARACPCGAGPGTENIAYHGPTVCSVLPLADWPPSAREAVEAGRALDHDALADLTEVEDATLRWALAVRAAEEAAADG